MAKLTKQKARKEYTCYKCNRTIDIGEEYQKIVARYSKPKTVCCNCKVARSELTGSEYYAWLYDLQDNMTLETIEDMQQLLEEIREQKSELEERYYNIPEQLQDGYAGDILQERIDGLDEVYSELESIIDEIENIDESNLDTEIKESDFSSAEEYEEAISNALEEHRNNLIEDRREEVESLINSIE